MVYIHFPANFTEEELMLQTKYQKLKKKKKAIQALRAPKPEPEKPIIPKRPAEARDAREVAKKLLKSGAIPAISKQQKQPEQGFKRPRGLERKLISDKIVSGYQPFSAVQMEDGPENPENKPPRIKNLYDTFATARDREERGLGEKQQQQKPDKPRQGNTIYVSGYKITEDFLKKHFSTIGSIINISMEIEKNRGFITFDKVDTAERAISEFEMVRGGRGYSSSRSSYRGSSNRGNSSWGGGGSRGGYSGSSGRYSSFSMDSRSPYDSKSKYSNSDRFSRSDDFHKPYRSDSSYMGRDSRRSPDRKRQRLEASSSRHDSSFGSYGSGSGRHDQSSSYRRGGFPGSSDRHSSTPYSRRSDDFRRPMGRGGPYRGRPNSRGVRGSRGMRGGAGRDRPMRRPLLDSSYGIRKRIVPSRATDYSRKLKISRLRSAIVARRAADRGSSDKEDSDEEDKPKEKADKSEEDKNEEEKGEGDSSSKKAEADKAESVEEEEERRRRKRTFIKLVCPHCSVKVITFRKYEMHLMSRNHVIAMRKVAIKQKGILAQMRQAQRNAQNEMEKNGDSLITKMTNFCPLCKLNYKTKKAVHQLSESHKNMKKFLMPFCKVCNITFKSPMIYENHCCSIDHIKRKQRMENSDGSGEEELELENFTTIDSVGDVDGDGSDTEMKKEAADDDDEDVEEEEDSKQPVNVGIEQIRKIEAHFCDLCKMYLPRPKGGEEVVDSSKILARHCKQRVHMQRYVRLKERQDLEKRAEKLQRKELAEKEVKTKKEDKEDASADSGDAKKGKETTANKAADDDDDTKDDKLWADVDKDLGDILAEAESGNKSSDEDEDSHVNGERYDRFKLSEKNGDEKLMTADEESMLDNKLVVDEVEEKK
ncbi:unnamed protein product [Phaedon cochleariae]|uniref:Negative elongation factor E n=1 Tax=Phaedon cochleariae TaxID=80249 RepID=A0A9P0DV50_PHACE|nr:unnamed protein product [Phaedon cochleariae]